jgi:hypothetical protein
LPGLFKTSPKDWPYEFLAGTGYTTANLTLMINGALTPGAKLFPTWETLAALSPSAWQSIAGFLWLLVALNTYRIKTHPDSAVKQNAVLNLFANSCLLISGMTQEAFGAHALGLVPAFIATGLMFLGNKTNERTGFYARYPVACAAFLFITAVPPLMYNAVLSQDWVLTIVIVLWFFSHCCFMMTDRNFQRKIFS